MQELQIDAARQTQLIAGFEQVHAEVGACAQLRQRQTKSRLHLDVAWRHRVRGVGAMRPICVERRQARLRRRMEQGAWPLARAQADERFGRPGGLRPAQVDRSAGPQADEKKSAARAPS